MARLFESLRGPGLRAFFQKRWFDLLLGAASAAAFGLFAAGAGNLAQDGGLSSTIATLRSGDATRRPRDGDSFKVAVPGTQFKNLDAVWAERSSKAALDTPDGYSLTLEPHTLIVFRKPFSQDDPIDLRFRVITGRVTIQGRGLLKSTDPSENRFEETPDEQAKPITQVDGQDVKTYPGADSSIFVAAGAPPEIPFTWARPLSGYLVISKTSDSRAQYVAIHDESYSHAVIVPDHPYFWQIVNPARKPLLGPFRFELRSADGGGLRKAIQEPPTDRPKTGVEVMFRPDKKNK